MGPLARVHLVGELVGCEGFPSGRAYLAEWWLAAGVEWALERGKLRGRTHAAYANEAFGQHAGGLCHWGHPIDAAYATPTLQGWPKLCVAIRAVDPDGGLLASPASGREDFVAYGAAPLPAGAAGEHEIELTCWQPCDRLTRVADETFAFLTGARPELSELNTGLVADRTDMFARSVVTAGVGKVRARVAVLTRDVGNARLFAYAPWHRARGAGGARDADALDDEEDDQEELRAAAKGLNLDGALDERERARREALAEARALRAAGEASTTGPPQIVIHPSGAVVPAGTLVTLRVAAGGQPPLAYQWERDGQPLEKQTERFMRIKVRRIGEYTCVVRNLLGAVRTKGAKVELSAAAGDEGVFARLNRMLANSEKRIRQLFSKYDTDETGSLERDELRSFMRELLPGATRPELRYLQALRDVDGDGQLSFLELVQSIRTCRGLADAASGRRGAGQTNMRFKRVMQKLADSVGTVEGGLREVFDSYDKDQTGTLDQRELSKCLREVAKPANNDELRFLIASVLHSADVDGNGELGFDELERTIRRINVKDSDMPLPEGRRPLDKTYGPVA